MTYMIKVGIISTSMLLRKIIKSDKILLPIMITYSVNTCVVIKKTS